MWENDVKIDISFVFCAGKRLPHRMLRGKTYLERLE